MARSLDAAPTVSAHNPPPIPAARSDSAGHPRRPLLVWVRTGTAHVHIDRTEAFRLTAGQGAWIPADGWEHRAIATEPGTIAFPLFPDPGIGAGPPTEPTRFEVPDSWQDWLIQHFNLQNTPLTGYGYSHDAITDLLRRPGSPPPAPAPSGNTAPWVLLDPPAMPRSAGARAVAEELTRDPALDITLREWAARVLSSPSTLLRDFRADTGLTFEQWRLRCRLIAATEFLAAGYEVDQVAMRVGFTSRGGFTHAFKRHFGSTPSALGRELAVNTCSNLTGRGTVARQSRDLVRMVRGGEDSVTAPDLLPPASTSPHANDWHVLSWMYRGSGYLDIISDIGDRRYERGRRSATWIPAGMEHTTGLRENSISLPLGDASTGDLQLTEPLQVQFSPAWDDYLMFCAISSRSILQPDDYDPTRVLDLFTEQVAAQRALSVPMPTDQRAHAAATSFLRTIAVRDRSAAYDLPAEVHRAFRDQTGMTFTRWRYAARMRIARDLLNADAKPSAVAQRVGYAHLPTFSAAFTRFHGISPREYQEREAEPGRQR